MIYSKTINTQPSEVQAKPGCAYRIVFAHGVGDSSLVFQESVQLLGNELGAFGSCELTVFDQPGHGQSDAVDPSAYGPTLAYETLLAIINQPYNGDIHPTTPPALNLPTIIVGHSLGAYLGLRFAIESSLGRQSATLAGLVVVAGGPGFKSTESLERWNVDIDAQIAQSDRHCLGVGHHNDTFVMENLLEIKTPMALVVGSRDKAFSGAFDYLAKKFPESQQTTIADCGHNIPGTNPTELTSAILRFMNSL